jgi:pyruvate carboxylase
MSSGLQPKGRSLRRVLVPNRGEIASRIVQSCRELNLETITIYTGDDKAHTINSTQSVQIPTPQSYLDIDYLVSLCKQHQVDAVHPGYGFLSESAEFARRLIAAGILFIGPSADILESTGDKLKARELAEKSGVPVLPALQTPTRDISYLRDFGKQVGFPIMIKAVDGGGGRGIRLVRSLDALEALATRAIEESPSKLVFAEKAAVDGFSHIEIQIVGDGYGNVTHLYERDCSIQRRYQKVVEIAPSQKGDRGLVRKMIQHAIDMAKSVSPRPAMVPVPPAEIHRSNISHSEPSSFLRTSKLKNASSWR